MWFFKIFICQFMSLRISFDGLFSLELIFLGFSNSSFSSSEWSEKLIDDDYLLEIELLSWKSSEFELYDYDVLEWFFLWILSSPKPRQTDS